MPLIQVNSARLQVEPVNVFIVPSNQLNAYTFGMDSTQSDRALLLLVQDHGPG